MKGDDIADRLLRFAVLVLGLVRSLPGDTIGRHLGKQLVRAATAGGANYEEARSAESPDDFVHKVSIAARELRVSRYWLRLSAEANLAVRSVASNLEDEASELAAILTASAKTARARS
jgi:four helix bundle protein